MDLKILTVPASHDRQVLGTDGESDTWLLVMCPQELNAFVSQPETTLPNGCFS